GITLGTDYKIRVESIYNSSLGDDSDADFEIVNVLSGGTTVEVVQPNGGEVILRGTTYLISWNDDVIENVFLKLYKNNVLITAANSGLPAYGASDPGVGGSTHIWLIPSGITLGTDYKIRVESIYDNTLTDYSDNNFEITNTLTGGTFIDVIQPNGGESWMNTTTHLISWNDDVIENVDIQLYLYNASNVFQDNFPVATSVVGTTYSWTIDNTVTGITNASAGFSVPDSYFKIKVFTTVSSVEDFSDAYFSIIAYSKSPFSNDADFGIGNDDDIVLYPNPTSTEFTVSTAGIISKVEVRNILGQVLYTNNVDATQTVINVNSYDAGMYIVNITVQGEVITKKIFVQ
ncbi:MAG: T9SS type A sorting domain-containing protein, partial [Bacteroidota bacterium]